MTRKNSSFFICLTIAPKSKFKSNMIHIYNITLTLLFNSLSGELFLLLLSTWFLLIDLVQLLVYDDNSLSDELEIEVRIELELKFLGKKLN